MEIQNMIYRLKSYQNGIHGDFFLAVAHELERLQDLSEARLENIKAMSSYLDGVAEALGVPNPRTPVEGGGACWEVMAAILQRNEALALIASASLGQTEPEARGQLEVVKKIAKGSLSNNIGPYRWLENGEAFQRGDEFATHDRVRNFYLPSDPNDVTAVWKEIPRSNRGMIYYNYEFKRTRRKK
jgi:hypothetical protein